MMAGEAVIPPEWAAAGQGFERIDETRIHDGYIWSLATATYRGPNGDIFERDVVRSPGSVAVVPLTNGPAGPIVTLVSQYRSSYERAIIEIPAGMCDVEGESLEGTARRELVEEVGLHAGTIRRLTGLLPSPGMTDSVCTIFLATDCVRVADDRQGPEEVQMVLIELMLNEAVQLVDNATITDAKTVAGLLLAKRFVEGDLVLAE